MSRKTKKEVYISPYKTEYVSLEDGRSLLIQYISETDRKTELVRRIEIMNRRPLNEDLKMTDYFAKRSENIVKQLFDSVTVDTVYEIILKAVSVSYSMHFRYRDFKDLIKRKEQELFFTDKQKEILELVNTSLNLNDVIAAKIGAIANRS